MPYSDKLILKRIEHLNAELVELIHNTKPKPKPTNGLPVPIITNHVSIPRAFEIIKEFIDEELEEWEDREAYGKIGICIKAKKHLEAVENFFEEVCDVSWTCTHRLGDI